MSASVLPVLVLAGGALLVSAPAPEATASDTATQATTSQAARTPALPAASGLRVFIDPETGAFTSTPPTAEAATALAALEGALSRSSAGLFETTAADGSPMIDLEGRFQNVSLVGLTSGAPRLLCTTSAAAAGLFVAPRAAPLPAAREER